MVILDGYIVNIYILHHPKPNPLVPPLQARLSTGRGMSIAAATAGVAPALLWAEEGAPPAQRVESEEPEIIPMIVGEDSSAIINPYWMAKSLIDS